MSFLRLHNFVHLLLPFYLEESQNTQLASWFTEKSHSEAHLWVLVLLLVLLLIFQHVQYVGGVHVLVLHVVGPILRLRPEYFHQFGIVFPVEGGNVRLVKFIWYEWRVVRAAVSRTRGIRKQFSLFLQARGIELTSNYHCENAHRRNRALGPRCAKRNCGDFRFERRRNNGNKLITNSKYKFIVLRFPLAKRRKTMRECRYSFEVQIVLQRNFVIVYPLQALCSQIK